jgi:hypothetical protein
MATIGIGISDSQAASVSLSSGAEELSTDQKKRINDSVGAQLEKRLRKDLIEAFGAALDANKIVSLTAGLNTAIRASLSTSLGLDANTGAGTTDGVAMGGAGGVQGGSTLGYSAGLRNAQAGAGGGGEALAGIKLGGGIAASSVPGLTAGLSVSADPRATANFKLKASVGVKASLDAILDEALAGASITPEKRAELKNELGAKLNDSLDSSLRSALGPAPGYPHAAGVLVLESEVRMPLVGAWHASVVTDPNDPNAAPPTGPFRIEVDGIEFVGTVAPGRAGGFGGRTAAHMVGGAGGYTRVLEPKNYASGITKVRTVVDDILREAGETLSAETDTSILEKQLKGWQRGRGQAQHSLVLVLDQIGATWRVLRDGTTWIGVDTWPEVEPDGQVLDEDWSDGMIVVAPERPNMVPGIVVRGQRIEQVVHRNERSGLRTELYSQSVKSALQKVLGSVRSESDFAKRWPCKVVRQNADGTVQVLTDDDAMRGKGADHVRIRVGIPGTTVKVKEGARGLLGFDNADPSLPFIDSWESETPFVKISVGRDARPVARVGDLVRVMAGPLMPVQGTISGNPLVGGVITITTPFQGVIETGGDALESGLS